MYIHYIFIYRVHARVLITAISAKSFAAAPPTAFTGDFTARTHVHTYTHIHKHAHLAHHALENDST